MGVDLIDAVGAISATVASHGHQMKASLTFFILSLLIGANGAHAQQAKRSADEAGGPQATQAMHHDEAGTVTYRGQLGGSGGGKFSLKIGPMHESKSWVGVYVRVPKHSNADVAGQGSGRRDRHGRS